MVVGSKSDAAAQAKQPDFGTHVSPAVLTGRKYVVLRQIGDSPKASGKDAQKGLISTFYGAIEEWDP